MLPIIRYGDHGDSGRQKMAKAKNHKINKFEKNSHDLFDVSCVDIGNPVRVVVELKPSGFGSDWHLDSVSVDPGEGAEAVVFQCDNWFSKKIGYRKELLPEGTTNEDFEATASAATQYHLEVVTGDIKHAGTDSHVYCIL